MKKLLKIIRTQRKRIIKYKYPSYFLPLMSFILIAVSSSGSYFLYKKAAPNKNEQESSDTRLECKADDLDTLEYITVKTENGSLRVGYPVNILWAQYKQPITRSIWMRELMIPIVSDEDFNLMITERRMDPNVISQLPNITVNKYKASVETTETENAKYVKYYLPILSPKSDAVYYYVIEGRLPKFSLERYVEIMNTVAGTAEIIIEE
jgi:hypothetical protein